MSSPANWDELTDEAVRLLCEYIRIDTTNPPGNESLAAHWLGGLLQREGVVVDYYEPAPGRESVIARLPGSGGGGQVDALILLNHTDVVPVEQELWTQPAFEGLVRDGNVWGRGALDMKSLGVLELLVFLLFKRLGLPHRRDLVFFAAGDEEAGSEYGVEWFARNRPDLLRAFAVINEGGVGMLRLQGNKRPVFGIAIAEKTPLWLRLRTKGRPGHASLPHGDNALDRLVTALGRVLNWRREREITPETALFFEGLAAAGVGPPVRNPMDAVIAAQRSTLYNALTQDTISLTTCNAGIKINVIPAVCEATLDCRLLPGREPDAFEEELRRYIDDPKVEVERIFCGFGPPSPPRHALLDTIGEVVREQVEDAVVVPSVGTGFTDSRTLRRLGVPSYGFSGILSTLEERQTVHGHDERIRIESLRLALPLLFEVVRRTVE
jgi:acetylornithine deacetylase/succinyl-diaminopimelate desuccinylase-like protein